METSKRWEKGQSEATKMNGSLQEHNFHQAVLTFTLSWINTLPDSQQTLAAYNHKWCCIKFDVKSNACPFNTEVV